MLGYVGLIFKLLEVDMSRFFFLYEGRIRLGSFSLVFEGYCGVIGVCLVIFSFVDCCWFRFGFVFVVILI